MTFLVLVRTLVGNVLHLRPFRRGSFAGGKGLILTGAVLVSVSLIIVLFFQFLFELYKNIVITGFFIRYPEAVFFTAFLVGTILLFFAAIPPAAALFNRREENEFFLALPVAPVRLAAARLTALFLILFPLNLFLSVPALLAYTRFNAISLRFLPGLVTGFITVPLLSAALAVLFVFAVRRLPRFFRFRAAAEIVFFVVLFALLAAVQLFLQHALIGLDRESENIFLVNFAEWLRTLTEAVPPLQWAASSFAPGEELFSALFFLLFAIALFLPAFVIAVRAFPGSGEPSAGRTNRAEGARQVVPRGGVLRALVFREWRLFFASAQTVFEVAVRLLVLPAFICIYGIAGPREYIDLLLAFASASPLVMIASIAVLFMLVDLSFLAATGLAREQKQFGLSLSLPLPGGLQVKAKLIFLLLLSLPSAGLVLLILYVLFPFPAETLVYTIPGVIVFQLFSFCVGSFLELKGGSPLSRQRTHLLRQNKNTLAAFFLQASLLACCGALAWGLYLLGMSPFATTLLIIELIAALDFILLPRLFRCAERRYAFELEGN